MKIAIPININKKDSLSLNRAYIDYVIEAGFEPLLLCKGMDIKAIAEQSDGLILTGGADVDPTYYGFNNIASNSCDLEKDSFEREVIDVFTSEKKKIFGVCRGFQLLFREYLHTKPKEKLDKLDYRQDLSKHNAPKMLDSKREALVHSVSLDHELLYGEKGESKMFVNSIHHQAVILNSGLLRFNHLTKNFKICATTGFGVNNLDRVVEAISIEDFNGSKVLAVQWHPEEMKDYKLIKNFFN